jgi:hypothetical protein
LIVPVIVVALLAVDPLINASKYMSYYDYRDRYIEDELVNWLRSKPKPFRVKLWSENPYLRYLTTEVLPYHGIDTADAILSRRPRRYSEFFRAVREGTIPFERYLQMFNAKYVLSPLSLAGVDIPFKLSASFRTPSDAGPPGECHVYEFADYLPRAYIVGKFEVTETENVLNSLGKQGLDLSRVVILEKRPLSAPGVQDVPPEWNIKSLSNSPHRVVVNITVDRPAILVVQDFTDAYWHVYVDTEKAELMRANYLMRAVSVPEGSHTVTFTYDPPLWGYAVTLLGWIVIVSLIVCNVVRYVMTWWKANITTV